MSSVEAMATSRRPAPTTPLEVWTRAAEVWVRTPFDAWNEGVTALALAPITAWTRAATTIARAPIDAWSGGMRAAVTAPISAVSHTATTVTRSVLRAVLPGSR